jgi:hypothetical protein
MLRPRRAWPLHSASLAARGPHHSGRSTQPPLRPVMPYGALASLLVQRLAPPHPPREPPVQRLVRLPCACCEPPRSTLASLPRASLATITEWSMELIEFIGT